jgi:formylglycine-generating enzyme required for sulfatase activity
MIALLLAAASALASCPLDMVELPHFCIDRFEAPNEKGVRPFVARGADEGAVWCAARGKRLCTDREWVRACEGESKRAYPYGNTYRRGACNDDKTYKPVDWALVNKYPAAAARRYIAYLNQSDPSGSHPDCVSEEGVYDLAGNAAEWVIRPEYLRGAYKAALMGCYWSGCYNMHRAAGTKPGCHGTMNPGHPGEARRFRTYEAGFRCCL